MEAMDEKIVAVTGGLDPYGSRNLEIDRAVFKAGDKVGYDRAMAQLADMTEECKQMGRSEVVEWLRDNPMFIQNKLLGIKVPIATSPEWQAKLKSWGLK